MAMDFSKLKDPAFLAAAGQTLNQMAWAPVSPVANMGAPMAEYQKMAQAKATENKTLQWLQQNDPEAYQYAQAGLPVNDAFKYAVQKRQEAQQPAQLPASAQEYEYAKRNGFQGTFMDYKAGNEKPLAPTDIERKLMAAGIDPKSEQGKKIILQSLTPKGTRLNVGPDGTISFTDGVADDGTPALNVEQGKNTGFLMRAQDAEKVISANESEGTSMWNKAAANMPLGAGNYMISQDAQKLNQAKRDFINAVLRQESGAVISPEEFANAEQQYFPQPGDGPDVLKQKAQNRKNAVEGFRIRSGPGADVVDKQQAAQPQNGIPDVSKMSDAELEALANGQ